MLVLWGRQETSYVACVPKKLCSVRSLPNSRRRIHANFFPRLRVFRTGPSTTCCVARSTANTHANHRLSTGFSNELFIGACKTCVGDDGFVPWRRKGRTRREDQRAAGG